MKVIGFCAWSGAGKTTLVEQLVRRLREAGERVSVIKHAHHAFDIDHEGKDSWRHRRAGAHEVVIASSRRVAKIRELDTPREPTVHELLAELDACDWVLVEGFKHADLLKIEVWRDSVGKRAQYPDDPYIVAVATDEPARLPQPTGLPVFELGDIDAIVRFLLVNPARYDYTLEQGHGSSASKAADAVAGRGPEAAA